MTVKVTAAVTVTLSNLKHGPVSVFGPSRPEPESRRPLVVLLYGDILKSSGRSVVFSDKLQHTGDLRQKKEIEESNAVQKLRFLRECCREKQGNGAKAVRSY